MYVLKMKSGLFVYIYGMLQLHHKNNYYYVIMYKIHMILHYLYYFTIFTTGKTSS
jgi:hypothetical protein